MAKKAGHLRKQLTTSALRRTERSGDFSRKLDQGVRKQWRFGKKSRHLGQDMLKSRPSGMDKKTAAPFPKLLTDHDLKSLFRIVYINILYINVSFTAIFI